MIDARRIRVASGSESPSEASDSDVSSTISGDKTIVVSRGPSTATELAIQERQDQIKLLDLEEELARKMAARAARVAAAAAGSATGVAATPTAAAADTATGAAATVPKRSRGPYRTKVRALNTFKFWHELCFVF